VKDVDGYVVIFHLRRFQLIFAVMAALQELVIPTRPVCCLELAVRLPQSLQLLAQ